jgi:phosphopantetheine--protein transferase-like protein
MTAGLVVGIDAVPVAGVARLIAPPRDTVLDAVFAPGEQARARAHRRPAERFAVALAVKEAVGKALGAGLTGIDWTDIEARVDDRAVTLHLSGGAAARAADRGVTSWSASWTRAAGEVVVTVVGRAPGSGGAVHAW